MNIEYYQIVLAAALLLTIIAWTTGIVKKWITSLFLLAVFVIFGRTPLTKTFSFLLSDNLLTVAFSYVFCKSIEENGLITKLISPILSKTVKGYVSFSIFVLLFNVIGQFIIPQPFARVLIILSVMRAFLNECDVPHETGEILKLFVFVISVVSNMMLIQGDVIVNYAVFSLMGAENDPGLWMKAMALPALAFCILQIVLFRLVFAGKLKGINFASKVAAGKPTFAKKEIALVVLIVLTIAAMATVNIHGVDTGIVLMISSVILTVCGFVKFRDWKCIDFNLLIFLTAAFAIGPVMQYSGIADILFGKVSQLLPDSINIWFYLAIFVVAAVVHMVLGSSITSLSILIPGISIICGKNIFAMIMLVYLTCYGHYFLPIHNALFMVGSEDYNSKHLLRFGLFNTALLIACIVLLFLPWWNVIGLL